MKSDHITGDPWRRVLGVRGGNGYVFCCALESDASERCEQGLRPSKVNAPFS